VGAVRRLCQRDRARHDRHRLHPKAARAARGTRRGTATDAPGAVGTARGSDRTGGLSGFAGQLVHHPADHLRRRRLQRGLIQRRRRRAVPVMTVLGPVPAASLGVTLMHEHLLIDVSYKWRQPVEVTLRAMADEPITLANMGRLRRNIGLVRDNLRISDADVAAAEVMEFKKEGGGTIVDVTTIGIGRDPRALRAISAMTGIHVVTCCGYYLANSHPPSVARRSAEELAAEMIDEIENGIGNTG